jgi:hypothetical protein
MAASPSVPVSRLIRRDPRVWVSVLVMAVFWGIALLNMAGFSVKRRGTSVDAADWKMTVGFAVVASAVLIPLVVARLMMWKKVVPTPAIVDGQPHRGKFSVVPNSPLFRTQPGDQITVYVHPQKPNKSIMPL